MTWLLAELDPDDNNPAFGLCDIRQDFPDLGYGRLGEITRVKTPLGHAVERDLFLRSGGAAVGLC